MGDILPPQQQIIISHSGKSRPIHSTSCNSSASEPRKPSLATTGDESDKLQLQQLDTEEVAACMVIAAHQYLYGISGVARNIGAAVRLFRASASLGNAAAQYMFGACCCDHLVDPAADNLSDPLLMSFKGAPADDPDVLLTLNATYWYRAAAVQGHAAAQNELGVLLFHGGRLRERRRHSKAKTAGAVSIFAGDHTAVRSRPEFTALLDGPDEPLACMWFRRAAEAGHAGAMYNLACCLENGRGVTVPDVTEAAHWYLKSALHNHEEAAVRLCRLLLSPRGDTVTAVHLQRLKLSAGSTGVDLRVRVERALSWLSQNAPADHPNTAEITGFIQESISST